MPFLSKKQQRFAYANPEKFGGKKGLKEWSSKTDFESLPEKVKNKKKKKSTHKLPILKSHIEKRLVHGKYGTYFKNFNISDSLLEKEQVEKLFNTHSIKDLKIGFENMKQKRDELRKNNNRTKQEDEILSKLNDAINCIADEAKKQFKKSDGGVIGMSTTSGGEGLITVGQGSYPKFRNKKKKKVRKSLPISLSSNGTTSLNNLSDKEKQMLRDAIVEEYKAVNIYEMMANNTENENLKKVFLDITKEEKIHVGEFETMLNSIDYEHMLSIEEGNQEIEDLL